MDISKAEEILSDLVESTSRMDGRPLQYTTEEFKEAYDEFVKHVNVARIASEDLKKLAEGSATLAKNAQIAASKLIDVASMYPVGFSELPEKVNCTDDSCIYPVEAMEAKYER